MKTRVAYLIQRGPTFQLLLPIPGDLHDQFKRKDLRWSRQTGDLRVVQRKTLRPPSLRPRGESWSISRLCRRDAPAWRQSPSRLTDQL